MNPSASISTPSSKIGSPGSDGAARKLKKLAIVGHPNVGKSVIFHALTGKYVTVSNFPGTTVDLAHGRGHFHGEEWEVIDTPGVHSLQAATDDERVARNFLLEEKPDVILQVADAKNLAKTIHLTLELAEFGFPVVLALNMSDERQDRGIQIDAQRLSQRLGIPVVETVAITGDGIPEIRNSIPEARKVRIGPRYDRLFSKYLDEIQLHLGTTEGPERALAISLVGKDSEARDRSMNRISDERKNEFFRLLTEGARRFARPADILIFEGRQAVTQEIVGEVQILHRPGQGAWLAKFGQWAMRPFPGYVIAGAVLFVMYEFVGVFGAGTLVNILEKQVFGEWLNPLVIKLADLLIPFSIVRDAIVGEYGAFTMALTYAFALIFPIVSTFFLFFGVLEDSGYLPRLAVMMDRFFRLMGLNGRAVLPMVLGLGCDTMATVTTRILDTRKEKIILSLLLTLSVPCSAQLGAILGMAAGLSSKVLLIWLSVTAGTMMLVGWVAALVLPGGRSPFLVELPPMRTPRLSNIWKKVTMRLKWYTKEIIPLFVLATFVLFVLDKIKLLEKLEQAVAPVVVSFLGLPAKAAEAFLIGFFRRDYGAAGFFQMAQDGLMDARQVTVAIVVITLFMPCIAHVLVTIKERGVKTTAGILGFVLMFSLGIGGLINWLLKNFPQFL